MSRTVFVDTAVLLYAVDDQDLAKRDQARRWLSACWTGRCGRLSHQVLNEFYLQARQKFPSAVSAGDARAEVRRYQNWRPWVIDHPTVEAAWAIEARYQLGFWDALIVSSAQQQGCDSLLTDALPHGQQIDGVHILNPFTLGPETLALPAP